MYPCCTRRRFLAQSAAATGAVALGSRPLLAAPVPLGDKPAEMTIARWTGAKDPAPAQIKEIAVKLTEQAIAGLGGLKRFVKQQDVVWVKPNIAWGRTPELAANTNPDVVATIVRLCLEAGAKTVKVGDNPCNTAKLTYENSGIAAAARDAGAKVVFLDTTRFRKVDIKGEQVKLLPLYPEIIEADLVINVPVVKHHVLAKATLCMKNYMGVMDDRQKFHQDIAACVADLTRYMQPRLCIVDAVRALMAHGPRGGKLEDVKTLLTVAAGVDIVALDAFGAELMGKQPQEIGTIVAGEKAGLGKADYRRSALRELSVS